MSHNHHHQINYQHVNLAFLVGIGLNISYVAFEAISGIILGSAALLSDAGHNFSDVVSLVLGYVAVYLSRIRPNERLTYGFRKTSILAAFVNSMLLLVAVGIIAWESAQKLLNPTAVNATAVAWIALVGIVINSLTALFFYRWTSHDLNLKAVFWHMVADALVSIGVVIGALAMKNWQIYWLDGAIGLIISVVILVSTWDVLRESFFMSIDAVPKSIDLNKLQQELSQLEPVHSVHHIHVWPMSTTEVACTAHVVLHSDLKLSQLKQLRETIAEKLSKLGITHSTVEFEYVEAQCTVPTC